MMGIIKAAFAIFLFLASQFCLADDTPNISVRFGVVEIDPKSKEKVVIESRNIPFKDCKTDAAYGYSVSDRNGRRISTNAVFYPPSPVKKVDDGLWGNAATAHQTGLATNTVTFKGSGIFEHCFTESDPQGEWKVEIFVNAVKFDVITFKTTN